MALKNRLMEQLADLPGNHRVAFAASCCERLLPNYDAFAQMEDWGDPDRLRCILDNIWCFLEGVTQNTSYIEMLIQECEPLVPRVNDFDSLFVEQAFLAGTAVLATLECCLHNDVEEAAEIGCSYSIYTLFGYLNRVNYPGIGPRAIDEEFQNWLWHTPLIQAELTKQQEDLQILQSSPELIPEILSKMRVSSADMGIQPIGRGLVWKQGWKKE